MEAVVDEDEGTLKGHRETILAFLLSRDHVDEVEFRIVISIVKVTRRE